jgi:hypothetical protein
MRLRAALRGAPWLVSWLVSACATAPPPADPVKALQAQATTDLSCPAADLQIAPMGNETFGDARVPLYQEAQGCGLHVIYTATKAGYVLTSPKHAPPALAPNHVDVR